MTKLHRGAEGFHALAFLLLLAVNEWLIARHLQSPASLVAWLDQRTDIDLTVTLEEEFFEHIGAFLASPWFPLLLAALLVVCWLVGSRRWMLVCLTVYLVWATLLGLGALLVVGVNLFNPQTEAEVLLIDTVILWVGNCVVFGAWYWLIDHAGQAAYSPETPTRLHLLFPQTGSTLAGWEEWKPGVFDYLYVAFIVMAQFGPSDTIPLTPLGKSVMMIQTVVALLNVTLIASRAIGLVK